MRGGYREGAGRKQGYAAKSAEEARRKLSDMLISEIKPIAEALIARAKAGDVVAAKELFDRAWGKSLQSTEISGKDGKPAVVFIPSSLFEKYNLGAKQTSVRVLPSEDETVALE